MIQLIPLKILLVYSECTLSMEADIISKHSIKNINCPHFTGNIYKREGPLARKQAK